MTTLTKSHLLLLPNELLLYLTRYFLELQDLWYLSQTNSELRYIISTVIKTIWKIDYYNQPIMKLQCRAALISLSTTDSIQKEKLIHAKIIQGISSYKHKYVLIEDIDIRNRIRSTVDVIFHHAVFVSAIYRSRHSKTTKLATILVRLLTELDITFPSYCREITFTIADNIKAFLEYTGYKMISNNTTSQHITLHCLWSCFDFMGAAFIGKILNDHHIQCSVKRTTELLSNNTSFKLSLYHHLLNHWLTTFKREGSSDLIRSIRLEIE